MQFGQLSLSKDNSSIRFYPFCMSFSLLEWNSILMQSMMNRSWERLVTIQYNLAGEMHWRFQVCRQFTTFHKRTLINAVHHHVLINSSLLQSQELNMTWGQCKIACSLNLPSEKIRQRNLWRKIEEYRTVYCCLQFSRCNVEGIVLPVTACSLINSSCVF